MSEAEEEAKNKEYEDENMGEGFSEPAGHVTNVIHQFGNNMNLEQNN